MTNLKTAIENLYTTFSIYTTEGIHHCDCGCIKEENVIKLFSKPLRQLETDDICSYHGSALYTWGDLEHYKHFLPRFLELSALQRNASIIDLFEISGKLEYAEWTNWPEGEVNAIKDFVLADWIDFANNSNSEIRDTDLENYSRFFDIGLLLKTWNFTHSDDALRKFVMFFYYHGNRILNSDFKLRKKDAGAEFKDLIYTNNLTNKLQDEFFMYEDTDKEYAEKVSVVLLMIEQQLKVNQLNSKS